MLKTTWLRRISIYIATLTMTGFGLTGVASAQTITNTGPGSQNEIRSRTANDCQITNNNSVSVSNTSSQTATSGDARETNNTSTSWGGWSALSPATAKAEGVSYDAWWNHVAQWVSAHAGGSGWNSTGANLSWSPAGADWASYNPLSWQANGQSFGNWYSGVESYLDANNASWLLGWPADATGDFGTASTGNALNSNNSSFSVTINNRAHASVTPTTSCAPQTSTTPSQPGGGMGGGPSGGSTPAQHSVAQASSGSGGGAGSGTGSGGVSGSYHAPTQANVTTASASPTRSSTSPSSTVSSGGSAQPGGGMGGGPSGGSSNISNTGPGSTNTITSTSGAYSSVTNNTCVSVTNYSNQSATTGDANSSYNTSTNGGGSGNASNANGTALGAGISG